MILFCGLSSWLWTYFLSCSSTSIADFEHVIPAGITQKFCFSFKKNMRAPWSQRNLKISRLAFSGLFDIRGNLGNVTEEPTRKTCFSLEIKRLALRIYLPKFCSVAYLRYQWIFHRIFIVKARENMYKVFKNKAWAWSSGLINSS